MMFVSKMMLSLNSKAGGNRVNTAKNKMTTSNTHTTIELGYTLTDCYRGNANFNGQQKQYVIKIDGELKNIFLKGFVNGPADDGRGMMFHKITDLSVDQLNMLQTISENHKEINWNTGRYSVYTNLLSKKDYAKIKKAESDYIQTLITICQPVNNKAKIKTIKNLRTFIKPLISKKDYAVCDKFFYIF